MRISTAGLLRTSVFNIQKHFERLADNQEQLASGIRVQLPSDDPVATQRILSWRKVRDNIGQHHRNISSAQIWLNTTETMVSSIQDLVERAYELALGASNELLPQTVRQTYSEDIDTILKEVLRLSNQVIDDFYLLGGHQSDVTPFSAVTAGTTIVSVDYNGNGGQRDVELSPQTTMTINTLGSNDRDDDGIADDAIPAVLRDANLGIDVFDTLIDLRDDMIAGNVPNILNNRLPEMEAIIDNLALHRSEIGLKLQSVDLIQDIISQEELDVNVDIQQNEQADYATVVSNISYEQTIYQAANVTTSRLIQGSLFDFLQ
ncbi:MAG: flagellar hook-associated protein FlgL [Candidatus Omnitrophica bacterium]|nr:flagellar hook-associated protein FlgL [Candidatus Omnitrophota bacterium]